MSWQQQPHNPGYGQQWGSQRPPPTNPAPSYNPAYSSAPPAYSAPPPQASWRQSPITYSAGGLPGGPRYNTAGHPSQPPSQYGAPTSGYSGPPTSGYGGPPTSSYSGAPTSGYSGAPTPITYSAGGLPGGPRYNTAGHPSQPPSQYGAPTSGYSGPPTSGYGGPPTSSYGSSAGAGGYGAGAGGSGYGGATSGSFGGSLPQDQELMSWFKAVDNDNSGKITALELREALVNSNWSHFNAETCRLLIGMFDIDGDGTINFSEFSALWKYVQDWKACFTKFDKDGSGNIDAGELQQALQSFGYRVSMDFCNLCTRMFDRSDKRTMKFDDFIQCCVMLRSLTESFKKLDTNRNGVINVNYEQFLEMAIDNSIR